jgi:hypothetical protein
MIEHPPLWDPTGRQSAMGLPQESYWRLDD